MNLLQLAIAAVCLFGSVLSAFRGDDTANMWLGFIGLAIICLVGFISERYEVF